MPLVTALQDIAAADAVGVGTFDLVGAAYKPAALSGDVTLTGSFQGTAEFGGGNVVSAGAGDIAVARYDTGGTHQWSERFGGTNNDIPRCVAVDVLSNVVVTGQFTGTVDFGGGNLASAGSSDIFVAKLSDILRAPENLTQMARAARSVAKPEATQHVADRVMEVAHG